ncbi:glycine--tRNA ligase subunit beta [Candidatus Ichthyocystis sparus]|uniref:glycine--tRNA ligase subunit beta n=1 Tax=Candidatus Ichthyocystis sparus TaxID=1561004 RepID=UPI000B1B1D8D|nr:glycine--tRNA ligase subunit beta [Candidatus Ichthyocystis sparus]
MNVSQKTLLIEIGTEELPAGDIKVIREHISKRLVQDLSKDGFLDTNNSDFGCYTTPRRIVFLAKYVSLFSNSKPSKIKILPQEIAYTDNGEPTEALEKKLQRMDVRPNINELCVNATDYERPWLIWNRPPNVISLDTVIEKFIFKALHKIPSLKEMSWSTEQFLSFVRPIRNILVMHGESIIPIQIAGVNSTGTTFGHRVLCSKAIKIENPDRYEEQMEKEGSVIIRNEKRSSVICEQISEIAKTENVPNPIEEEINKELVYEISNIVEYPSSYVGAFPKSLLELPHECLELTMRLNQRYIILKDKDKNIINKFIMVANHKPKDHSYIIKGNERVLRARLADAKFFYEQDSKHTLEEYFQRLSSVVYHTKLGTQMDRTARICKIAKKMSLAGSLSVEKKQQLQTACRLCKADLSTLMVKEFPELQGVIGSYYAKRENKPHDVVEAIYNHYCYSFEETSIGTVSVYLNVSEKLESLLGLFSVNEIPTGEKDPFALRRKALGIVKAYTCYDNLPALSELINSAQEVFLDVATSKIFAQEASNFILERAKNYASQVLGYDKRVTACLVDGVDDINNLQKRHEELQTWLKSPSINRIVEARKRIENITKNRDGESCVLCAEELLNKKEEFELLNETNKFDCSRNHLEQLEKLSTRVEALFDHVMINDSNLSVRNNRIALLNKVKNIFDLKYKLGKL